MWFTRKVNTRSLPLSLGVHQVASFQLPRQIHFGTFLVPIQARQIKVVKAVIMIAAAFAIAHTNGSMSVVNMWYLPRKSLLAPTMPAMLELY